jgi:O-antigen ligase
MFLIIAIVAEAAYGNFQPFVAGYRFAGPTQPNNQACDCALLVLGALAAADVERRWRIYFRFAAIIGFAFLILTQSRTGIGAMLAALVAYFTAVLPRPARIAIACVLSLVCCVALFFYIFGTFGKIERAVALGRTDDDSSIDSFNGRAGVWRDVAPYILDRPLIGYGYGGFWTAARISHISDEEGWPIRDSHSAYVEYLCTLGVIGALAYVSMLLTGIWRAFGFFRVTHNPSFAFYGALLIFCALSGFLEGVASDPSLMMFLSMVVLTQLAFGPFRIGDERTLTAWPR